MYNSNRIIKEFENRGASFNYGNDIEEKIDFIIDHYSELMQVYRAIKAKEVEFEEKRKEAHRKLQNLRSNESRWKRTNKFPEGFDKDEHQARKDYLESLREKGIDITYNGKPLGSDMITFYILKHKWMFKLLDKFDLRVRKRVGVVTSKALEKVLWPMMKMTDFSLKNTDSAKTFDFLENQLVWLKSRPEWVNSKISNP